MERPKNKYYLEPSKLWGLMFLNGSDDELLKKLIRKEFEIIKKEETSFDPKEYIQDFINGDLINYKYSIQSYEKQKRLFAEAVLRRSDEFGWKNITIQKEDIWTRAGSSKKGSFFELVWALEKEKYINIKFFSDQGGPVFSVTEKLKQYIQENLTNNQGKESEDSLSLSLDFNEMTREIKVNGILVAKPYFDSPNDNLMQIVYTNQGKPLTRETLSKKVPIKSFNVFLNGIGIKGTVRKYLFGVHKDTIVLRKNVMVRDLEDIKKLKKELDTLRKGKSKLE